MLMYKNGKIYVIRNNVNDKVYVGSTVQPLYKRWFNHKQDIKRYKMKLYDAMNEIGIENFYIELVENYSCNSKEELHAREGHFIRQYNSQINGYNAIIAGRKKAEYLVDKQDEIKNKRKAYYTSNIDAMRAKNKEAYEKNKEKLINYQKEYRKINKEKISDNRKEHYNTNREEVLARKKEKYVCECGAEIRKDEKQRHFRSKKHKEFIESKNIGNSNEQ